MSTFDEDGFTKYTGPQRKVEVSRKELLGVGGPRVPKAKQRQQQAAQTALEQEETRVPRVTRDAYEYDPSSDNALRRADQKQLEHLAVKKSKEVTSDLRNVLKISEEAKNVGSETLTTLKNQGEQITRVHEKTVQLEQEISQSEKVLNKLGGIFSAPWKVKKGKKITGPKYEQESSQSKNPKDEKSRSDLLGNSAGKANRQKSEHGNYLDEVEDETQKQDDMLDLISENLSHMKNMAISMGTELERQDKALDTLQADTEELHNREKQALARGNRILGRRR